MNELRILVVEDQQNWQEMLPQILRRLDGDVHVDIATNYGAALQYVKNEIYDLATVDLALLGDPADPRDSDQLGLELLRELRNSRRNRGCGLIVLTGYPTTARTRQALRDYAAYDFIEKDQFDDTSFLTTALQAIADAHRRTIRQLEIEIVRLVEFFTTIVSHELGKPLGHIKAILQDALAEEYGDLSDRQKKRLEQALDSLQDEINLIHQLENLIRVEAGKIEVQKTRCNIVDCMRAALDQVGLSLHRKGLHLDEELPTIGIIIEGDPTLLTLAFRNVLDNAIKFTEQGKIEVRCWQENDWVYIDVQDTGVGIPSNKLPYIFDYFYQVEHEPARRFGGMGAGLYLVRKWINMHKGDIDVVSAEGQGATFRIHLPLYQEPID